MAKKVEGIVVEIGGDTSKLGKALEDVNKESNSLKKELQGVETLLKLDPTNVELVRQKQELLNQAVEETRNKLNILKDVQGQVQAQFDKGEITAEQYRDFQREIISTEQKLGTLEEQARQFGETGSQAIDKNSNALDGMNQSSDGANTGMGRLTQVATSGVLLQMGDQLGQVGEKLIDIGKASLDAFKEVDEGLDKIVTKTGASGAEMEQFQGIFENLAGKLPIDFETIGSAVGEMNTQFGFTGDELESNTELMLKFAEISGQDVSAAAMNAKSAISAYGLSNQDLEMVLDSVTSTSQKSGVETQKLFDMAIKGAPQIKALGLSFGEGTELLGQFSKAGVDGDAALQALSKASVTYAKEGKTLQEGLAGTIDAIKNSTSETEALNIATEAFGSKAAVRMLDAVKRGEMSFDDLSASIGEIDGVTSETFANTLDPIDGFTTASNDMKLAQAQLGDAIATSLAPAFQALANVIQVIADWFGSLPGPIQDIIIIFGILTAVFMVLTPVILGIAAAQMMLNVSLAPIIGIILAVIAVIALIIAIVKNWGAITDWLSEKWNMFKDWIITLAEGLKNSFISTWEAIKNGVQGAINALWNIIVSVFMGIAGAIKLYVDTYKAVVVGAFNIIKDTISSIINGVMSFIKRVMSGESLFSIGRDMIQGLINGVKNMIGNVTKIISDLVDGIKNKFKGLLGIKSPSRWMRDVVGKMIPQGIAVGVKADTSKAVAAMEDLTGQVMDAGTPDMVNMMNRNPLVSPSSQMEGLFSTLNNGSLASKMDAMVQIMGTYLPKLGQEYKMVMDTGATVGALRPEFDRQLGNQSTLRERGR